MNAHAQTPWQLPLGENCSRTVWRVRTEGGGYQDFAKDHSGRWWIGKAVGKPALPPTEEEDYVENQRRCAELARQYGFVRLDGRPA